MNASASTLIDRYARRMIIENTLADAIAELPSKKVGKPGV